MVDSSSRKSLLGGSIGLKSTSMIIIYCDSVINHKAIDPDFEQEQKEAKDYGHETALVSFEKLKEGLVQQALKYVKPTEEKKTGVYRGWMLKPDEYRAMYEGLMAKNIKLINDPIEYQHCHYLPECYHHIDRVTAKTVWCPLVGPINWGEIHDALRLLDSRSLILKDYVKSEKHHWLEACFIPDKNDRPAVEKVVSKFVELRGKYLNEGLVFREYLDLAPLSHHSKSGMPLTVEFRLVFLNGKLIATYHYWDEGNYDVDPDLSSFIELSKHIESKFFTMDVAQLKTGEWIVIELGDAQVSGLPENANLSEFYTALHTGGDNTLSD